MGKNFIPDEVYKKIVEYVPVLCVDLLITNAEGEVLLVKRRNQPMKGRWWLVGGRVLKGESILKAAVRKGFEELGTKIKVLMPLGYYEEHYQVSPFNNEGGIHTLSVVVLATAPDAKNITLDNQSSAWKFSKKFPSKIRSVQPFNIIKESGGEIITDNEFFSDK